MNVFGSVLDSGVPLDGKGIVNLEQNPDLLGLPSSPGSFEMDGGWGAGVGSGQDFVFDGGELVLSGAPGEFNGLLSNFGVNLNDLIEIKEFTVTSHSFANGVLTIDGTNGPSYGPGSWSLRFGSLPLGGFNFHTSGSVTDITWHGLEPSP
jgi:hypothetical protein